MIRVPRFSREATAALRGSAARTGIAIPWYVACCWLGGGCLYTAPVWTEGLNQPPEILRPSDPDEHLLPLFSETRATVVAVDPENDPLAFVWLGPTGGQLVSTERQDGDLTTSTAEVPYFDEWIGQTIEVLVIDQSDLHNDVTVEFEVVAPW